MSHLTTECRDDFQTWQDDVMSDPYESPRERGTGKNRLFFFGIVLLLMGVALPVLGMAGTIGGMMHSFGELAETENASADSLASGISRSLAATLVAAIIGVITAVIGVVLIVVARRGRGGQQLEDL